jgi:hypothetical protein
MKEGEKLPLATNTLQKTYVRTLKTSFATEALYCHYFQ